MHKGRWHMLALVVIAALLVIGGGRSAVRAQDGGAPDESGGFPLTLFSVDAAYPALFQLLAPGDEPASNLLRPSLTVSAGDAQVTPLLYIAIENTGWSQGAIGVISAALDPDANYVALEVRDLGMAGYTVREDGQALVFPLVYDPDLDGEGAPGFRFDILIGRIEPLRVFRVVEEGGLLLFAQKGTLTDRGRQPERVTLMIDPEPVFGDLVFECHIEALPGQLATFTPTPGSVADAAGAAGEDVQAPAPPTEEPPPLPPPAIPGG